MSYIGAPNRNAKSGLKSTPGNRTMQQFTPEQMGLFQQMFGNLGPDSFLSKLAGGDEDTFNQIEAPALRQFSGVQGNIASRFSGGSPFGGQAGGMSARKSSGFQNTMGAVGSDFVQQLQGNRQDLQSQALRDLMEMSQNLLQQRPYATSPKRQKKPGFMESILGSSLPGAIGSAAGNMFGNNFFGGSGNPTQNFQWSQ